MPTDLSIYFPYIVVGLVAMSAGAIIGGLLIYTLLPKANKTEASSRHLRSLISLLRDKRDGGLVVEINDKLYKSVNMLPGNLQNGLSHLSDELLLWIGVKDIEERFPVVLTQSPDEVQLEGEALASSTESKPELEGGKINVANPIFQFNPEVFRSSSDSPGEFEAEFQLNEEVQPPSMNILSSLERVFTIDKSKDTSKSKSIARQVDEIIQEKLPGTKFRGKVIHLLELPGEGVVVIVDDERFEGVSDVPYPDVQDFLRECTAEWERRVGN